jgi:outer membrane protein assembly factor BamB
VNSPAFVPNGAMVSSPAVMNGNVYYVSNVPVITNTLGQTFVDHAVLQAVTTAGQKLWSRALFKACGPTPTTDIDVSSPAVGSGLVNGVVTPEVFVGWTAQVNGNAQGCVFDFNGLTGALIWAFPVTGGDVEGSPAIMSSNRGPLVVVGANDDHVYGFSLNYTGPMSGTAPVAWDYNTQNDAPPPGYAQYCNNDEGCGDGVWASPSEGQVLVNGTLHHYVFFGLCANNTGLSVGRLDAVDIDNIVNGSPTLAWSFWDPHPTPDNDFSLVQTLTDRNGVALRVFTAEHHGHMFSLDPATGHLFFDFDARATLGKPVAILNAPGAFASSSAGYEYIFSVGCPPSTPSLGLIACALGQPSYGYLVALNAFSTAPGGQLLWKSLDMGGVTFSTPATINQGANAVLFALGPFSAGSPYRGDLLAFDPNNGSLLADYPVSNHTRGTLGSLAVYGNMAFVPEGYGILDGDTWSQGGELAVFACAGCN